MQFMNVITWEPKDRDKVFKMLAEALKAKPRKGRKILSFSVDIYSNRAFELIEVDNPGVPETEFQVYRAYTKFFNIERHGVMELKEAIKLIPEA